MNKLVIALFLAFSAQAHAAIEPINETFEPPAANYPTDKFAKVAVVQWAIEGTILAAPAATADYAENVKEGARRKLEVYIREAASKGAKLVITPEFGILGYPEIQGKPEEEWEFSSRAEIAPYVEAIPGKTSDFFSALAKELKIYLHVGFAEHDLASDLYYNTVIAINPDGNIIAKYHKANLFELESQFLATGKDPGLYNSPWGQIGIIICADVYSNFPMNIYRTLNVPIIALSTSWSAANSGMDAFTKAAVQNHSYVLAGNQTYFPDSGVINPDGTAQSHIRQSVGVAYGYLPYASDKISNQLRQKFSFGN